MKKIIELKNVIEFYTLANKLKTTIVDDANNYSIADQLYGTIILAIAINNDYMNFFIMWTNAYIVLEYKHLFF